MRFQVKSKERVQQHGEVFTNEREVKAMLDMVKQQSKSITATFLEPACGDGNFLVEILHRKLDSVKRLYKQDIFSSILMLLFYTSPEVYTIIGMVSPLLVLMHHRSSLVHLNPSHATFLNEAHRI